MFDVYRLCATDMSTSTLRLFWFRQFSGLRA